MAQYLMFVHNELQVKSSFQHSLNLIIWQRSSYCKSSSCASLCHIPNLQSYIRFLFLVISYSYFWLYQIPLYHFPWYIRFRYISFRYIGFHFCHIIFCYIKFQFGYIRFVISESVISKSVISKGPSPISRVWPTYARSPWRCPLRVFGGTMYK